MQREQNKLLMIKHRIHDLNPALKKIANFIVKYPHKVKSMTIKELSEKCEVSQATITRFTREIGLGGYQELKLAIAETLSNNQSVKPKRFESADYEDICQDNTLGEIIDKVSFLTTQILRETINKIDLQEVRRALSAIENCRNLLIFCSGVSTVAAESMVFRLIGLGKFCVLYKDFSVQEISANLLKKDSLAIGISNSGMSISTVKGLEIAKSAGATTICITSFRKSLILKHADIRLITSVTSAFGGGHTIYDQSMLSTISQLLVLDMLYASYAARNYNKSVKMLEKTWSSVKYSRVK